MQTKAEKTRQFIIEQAAPIFNTKGYAGTSMSDIMAATGLAKGGIYGNFADKDEIAAEAFDYSMSVIMGQIRAKTSLETTAIGKLKAILDFYRVYVVRPTIDGGCVLLNTAIDADDSYPFLKKKARVALASLIASMERCFEFGIKNGELKPGIDTKREAEMFIAQIEGGIMMTRISDNKKLFGGLMDHLQSRIENELKR
ncbi:MAG: TetR/AcrR family transcriptional regulator [Bacteroidetes bacterium]|nr:TetR/AcrR family transcriptional regulator [Bacteroidota bacterium]